MAGQMTEKAALVTGAASGIGRATAIALAREAAKVVVVDIDDIGGNETTEMIIDNGGEATFFKADMASHEEIAAMVKYAVATYGRLDCAVNNAGIAGRMGVAAADHPEEDFDRVINVNLKGVWLCMKHQINQMLEQGGGSIVNMASAAGLVGLPNAAYTASKHGVVGLTKSAAITYAKRNIRINSICPGYVDTPVVATAVKSSGDSMDRLLSTQPIGRLGQTSEIAEAILWLCSDGASFMAGHAMAVDGGLIAQ